MINFDPTTLVTGIEVTPFEEINDFDIAAKFSQTTSFHLFEILAELYIVPLLNEPRMGGRFQIISEYQTRSTNTAIQ